MATSPDNGSRLWRGMHALLEPFEDHDWRWRATGGSVPEAMAELDNLRAALERLLPAGTPA